MAVSDYSTTAASNTSISGINIAEACPAGNLNNAIRQLMADLKAAGYAPLSGGTFTGGVTAPSVSWGSGSTAALGFLSVDPVVSVDSTDFIRYVRSSNTYQFFIGNAVVASFDATGIVTSPDTATAFGYKGLPPNAQTGAYTLVIGDMGKHISITTGGVVIPANWSLTFPIGTTIAVYNDSASSQTITIITDTLRLAGTATTGTRTLAGYGLATLVKVGTTTWVASGSGVS